MDSSLNADPDRLLGADLVDAAELLAAGRVGAETLTQLVFDRIRSTDAHHRAFQMLRETEALAEARACDARRASGEPLGALHGVPIAIKDLIDLAGTPNTMGSPVYADRVSETDAEVVRRLKAAGAVIIGKVKQTEGAFSNHHPSVLPPLNPWSAEAWTGVSSSGSGVAPAARLCFGTLGTDTGGSIRFPCAANGLAGLKATYGRVSRRGAFPLAESLDHIGPMARTVADVARLFAVIAGHDPEDPTSVNLPVPDVDVALGGTLGGLRLGIDRRWIRAGVHDVVADASEAAAEVLASLGVEIVDCRAPDPSELVAGWGITAGVEAAVAHRSTFPARRDEFGPVFAALLDLGLRSSALSYAVLERERLRYGHALDRVFEHVDALIVPAMPFAVPNADVMARADVPVSEAEPITFTAPFDYSGHPALTIPSGVDAEGLPLAFQLVGRRFGEAVLFALGAAYERVRGPMPAPPGVPAAPVSS
ncbi:MAG: amidase [Pseudomonadota bacterium]|nr:amidase [Pseudomonadota bacterium]